MIDEFQIIITQIDGVLLNAHPLISLSTDINDFHVLIPGHFLIGQPVDIIPEPQLTDVSKSRLSQ